MERRTQPVTSSRPASQSSRSGIEISSTTSTSTKKELHSIPQCILQGVIDACDVVTPVKCLYLSEAVAKHTKSAFTVNLVFLGGILMFEFLLRPVVRLILRIGPEDNGVVDGTFAVMYNMFWVYPMFFLSKVLNSLYYQDIADESYKWYLSTTKSRPKAIKHDNLLAWLSMSIADIIYTFFLELLMIVQKEIFGAFPIVGLPINLIYSCWLSSLYCFEYTWINQGKQLPSRLVYFEKHWAYFLGFGIPFTLSTFFLSFFLSSALYAMLFPVFIIVAVKAKPIASGFPESFPTTQPARSITSRLVKVLLSRRDGSSTSRN